MMGKKSVRECGYSVVEVLLAVSLLGVAAFMVTTLTDKANVDIKRAETISSRTNFLTSLERYASSRAGCNELIALNPLITTESFDVNPRDIVFNNWNVAGVEQNPNDLSQPSQPPQPPQPLPVGAPREFKDFTLLELRAILPNPIKPGLPTITLGSVLQTKTVLTLRARTRDKGLSTNQESRDYFIQIPVIVRRNMFNANDRQILACGETVKLQETCEVLNADYNEATGNCDRTTLANCIFRGSFSCLNTEPFPCTSDPSNTPNPYTGLYDCQEGETRVTNGVDASCKVTYSCYLCDTPNGPQGINSNVNLPLNCGTSPNDPQPTNPTTTAPAPSDGGAAGGQGNQNNGGNVPTSPSCESYNQQPVCNTGSVSILAGNSYQIQMPSLPNNCTCDVNTFQCQLDNGNIISTPEPFRRNCH